MALQSYDINDFIRQHIQAGSGREAMGETGFGGNAKLGLADFENWESWSDEDKWNKILYNDAVGGSQGMPSAEVPAVWFSGGAGKVSFDDTDPRLSTNIPGNNALGGWGTDWIAPAMLFAPAAAGLAGAFGAAGSIGGMTGSGVGGAGAGLAGEMAALEGAGAFGGEALGAAANSVGAFGGSVAPWTAGAGVAGLGGDPSWGTNLQSGGWDEAGWESAFGDSAGGAGGGFQMPAAVPETPAQLAEWGLVETAPGTWSMPNIPGSSSSATDWISKISSLSKLGLPASLLAGLFENNTNPLTGTVTTASNNALSSAGAFANMAPVGMQPSWQKAINLANSNTGAWQPYVDQAATYTNQAAGGLPSVDLSQYMNPYIDSILTPQIRNINLAADKERMRLAHLAKISGNDTYATPGSTSATRYGVEEGTLNDNRFKQIGDATGLAYKGAFDNATGLATLDLNRKLASGGAFNTLANTVGTQGRGDVSTLAGAGDLEAKPQENALTHAADATKLYTSVIPGTSSAITATNKPSVLGQAVGAFGAYNAANKAGWFD